MRRSQLPPHQVSTFALIRVKQEQLLSSFTSRNRDTPVTFFYYLGILFRPSIGMARSRRSRICPEICAVCCFLTFHGQGATTQLLLWSAPSSRGCIVLDDGPMLAVTQWRSRRDRAAARRHHRRVVFPRACIIRPFEPLAKLMEVVHDQCLNWARFAARDFAGHSRRNVDAYFVRVHKVLV